MVLPPMKGVTNNYTNKSKCAFVFLWFYYQGLIYYNSIVYLYLTLYTQYISSRALVTHMLHLHLYLSGLVSSTVLVLGTCT